MQQCPVVRVVGIEAIPHSKLVCLTVALTAWDVVTVVTGDHYEVGQFGFLVPEGAILPEKLLREMWLWNDETGKGRLAGKQGNRVKARMMGPMHSQGVVSHSLFYGATYVHEGNKINSPSWNPDWHEGHDVTAEVGITFK